MMISKYLNLKDKSFSLAIKKTFIEEKWKQNSSFKNKNKSKIFNQQSVKMWKNFLSKDEIFLIDILCYPELNILGYKSIFKNKKNYNLEFKRSKNIKKIINLIGKKNYFQELHRFLILSNEKKYEKKYFLNTNHFKLLKKNI